MPQANTIFELFERYSNESLQKRKKSCEGIQSSSSTIKLFDLALIQSKPRRTEAEQPTFESISKISSMAFGFEAFQFSRVLRTIAEAVLSPGEASVFIPSITTKNFRIPDS